MTYLGWYDPDKQRTNVETLATACERYRRAWGREPRIALVNSRDRVTHDTLEIRRVAHVAPNVYFVGEEAT